MTQPDPDPTNRDAAALAMEPALNLALMRLSGEHPAQVYTDEGYIIWKLGVCKQLLKAAADAGYQIVPKPTNVDRSHDPAIVRAAGCLVDLRNAMADVRVTTPSYSPGTGPTGADNCKDVLAMLDHGIRMIAAYLGLDHYV